MKSLLRISMVIASTGTLVGGAMFIGCGDSGNGNDGGTDGNTIGDTAGQDTSKPDTGTQDTGTQDTGTQDTGPMDGGGIALNCTSYCNAMAQVCTGAMNGQYLDTATCMAMCAKIPGGDAGAMMGNTLACRVYHVTVASQNVTQANTHCPHAGPYGFGQCGTECESFCVLYNAQCGANNFGGGGCTQACPGIANPANTTMSFLNATGNTLDCREYHLENAYKANDMNGAGHCAHVANNGGGVCQ